MNAGEHELPAAHAPVEDEDTATTPYGPGYFITGQPNLSDEVISEESDEAKTTPAIHSPVTMSHGTARQLRNTLNEAVASKAEDESP